MMAPALVLTLVVLVIGGLSAWVARLRRELSEARCAAAANQASKTERFAILEEGNESLRHKHRLLQVRFDDLQEEFVALNYSISHDLRGPLRSIDGFSQALVEDCSPQLSGTAHDYLQRVRTAALHLNAAIEALLGLGRLVRAPFQPERLDLSVLARGVVGELIAREPARRVEWHVQPGLSTHGDRTQIITLLRHLLGNAWKFSANRAVAHVSLRVAAEEKGTLGPVSTVYEVRDDGVGFDPQYAGRLFGVFQRLHAAGEFTGQGVGLAMAQRIVRRHGGKIWATAEPDGGAVFSFTLPEAPEDDAGETRTSPNKSAAFLDPPDTPYVPQPKPSAV